MGLDTSHDCWHGAYSAFMRWREKIAEVIGVPLRLMEGFYPINPASENGRLFDGRKPAWLVHGFEKDNVWRQAAEDDLRSLPLKWDALKYDVLHELLWHSDCEDEIAAELCGPLAARLEELLPLLEGDGGGHIGDYRNKTEQFIRGLRLAASRGEAVEFH